MSDLTEVLEAAAAEDHPLHGRFEWDGTVAKANLEAVTRHE